MYVSNRGGMTAAQFVTSDFWMHHNTRINQGHLIRSTCLQQTADNFIFLGCFMAVADWQRSSPLLTDLLTFSKYYQRHIV